jgi:hypothetical protein
MGESVEGAGSWEAEFDAKSKSFLDGSPEKRSVKSYILIQKEVEDELGDAKSELPDDQYQMVVHMVAGYRSELDPTEKSEIHQRIKFMTQMEKDPEKRKALEIAEKLTSEAK